MSDAPMAGTEITFEDGYDELKRIVARLDAEDVSVHVMCELFARGKRLEKALRGYLATQQGKLDEIEAGENLPEFSIVAPAVPSDGAARQIAVRDLSPRAPCRPAEAPRKTIFLSEVAELRGDVGRASSAIRDPHTELFRVASAQTSMTLHR